MKISVFASLAVESLLVAPLTSHADLSAYSQNFESVAPAQPPGGGSNPGLSADDWLVYGNVFTAGGVYQYGYGSFPAPNGSAGFSGVAEEGQGGPQQGNRQLVVYSDYNNSNAHSSGQLVEANVFQQRTIAAGDVGTKWTFQFDAKLGNLVAPTTALAFIKTLDPANGFQASASATIDMTAIPATWGTYSIPFTITAGAGQILQFGFSNTATNFNGSAIYYDNLSLAPVPEPSTYALMLAGLGLIGLAARRRGQ